jgi:hypothetical protein
MIEVKLNFQGTQLAGYEGTDSKGQKAKRNARFVYHCHILEHEDNGMMAAITVIDPENYR